MKSIFHVVAVLRDLDYLAQNRMNQFSNYNLIFFIDISNIRENSKLVDKLSEVQTLTNNKKRQLYIDVSNYDNNNGSNHGHRYTN